MSNSKTDNLIDPNNSKALEYDEEQSPLSDFRVPFPPQITTSECITLKDGKIPMKSPNCFIIYRRAFQKELRNRGCVLKLNLVSAMASQSWQREPVKVKKAYKEMARQINIELVEMRANKVKNEQKAAVDFNSSANSSSSTDSHTFDAAKNTQQQEEISISIDNALIEDSSMIIETSRIEDLSKQQAQQVSPAIVNKLVEASASPMIIDNLYDEELFEPFSEYEWPARLASIWNDYSDSSSYQIHNAQITDFNNQYSFEPSDSNSMNYQLYSTTDNIQVFSQETSESQFNYEDQNSETFLQSPRNIPTISSDIWLLDTLNFQAPSWNNIFPFDESRDAREFEIQHNQNVMLHQQDPTSLQCENDLSGLNFIEFDKPEGQKSTVTPSIFEAH
ncbi:836_t:CDS:1 [Ambispora gerdemannii]|uniref:836_t:CDS:1 n=1 Tax=Ambispora gerdemannii TaxID=144530 RepID=A0A9N8WN75_9GLOM|nr:836_t:CDS:1 [Ambispora gerdemannii]